MSHFPAHRTGDSAKALRPKPRSFASTHSALSQCARTLAPRRPRQFTLGTEITSNEIRICPSRPCISVVASSPNPAPSCGLKSASSFCRVLHRKELKQTSSQIPKHKTEGFAFHTLDPNPVPQNHLCQIPKLLLNICVPDARLLKLYS